MIMIILRMAHIKPLLLVLVMVSLSEQIVVSIAQGKLRGVEHSGYVAYCGIPYASVAGNIGRFRGAGLAPKWSGIRDSREPLCSTISLEDCLQLDVYVPVEIGSNWPVLVWVTGGTDSYKPGKLVEQGVIVVVVYHRQGPIGFLCMNDEKVPGNAGVKDVVLALRWVRDNIVAFKGNPARVVIAGQSFGAAMVEAITLSSMAHGLYQGVILQSGSVLCPWAFNYDAKERAAALLGMLQDSENSTKNLLESKIEELVANSNKLDVPYFPFGICLEKPMKKEEMLLAGTPFDLLSNKNGTAPMMIGYNSNEAYVFVSLLREAQVLKRLSIDKVFMLPDELKFLNERERKQVSRQIDDMYFNKNISMATVLAYHRDAYFTTHIHRSVRHHTSASSTPVYYYQFSHTGNLGVQPEPGVPKTGAADSDELAYLFNDEELQGEDGIIQRLLIKLWTNFVKSLNPTPSGNEFTWEPAKPEQLRLLDINAKAKMIDYPHVKAIKAWDNIYDKYYHARRRMAV